jgi:hypothetical protein
MTQQRLSVTFDVANAEELQAFVEFMAEREAGRAKRINAVGDFDTTFTKELGEHAENMATALEQIGQLFGGGHILETAERECINAASATVKAFRNWEIPF